MFLFDLHMYCDDMQMNWDWLFLSALCCGDGMRSVYRPMFWRAGSGLRCETLNPTRSWKTSGSTSWLRTTESGSELGRGVRGGERSH